MESEKLKSVAASVELANVFKISALVLIIVAGAGMSSGFLNHVFSVSTVQATVEKPAVSFSSGTVELDKGRTVVKKLTLTNNIEQKVPVSVKPVSDNLSSKSVRTYPYSSMDYRSSCGNSTVAPANLSSSIEPGEVVCVSNGTYTGSLKIDESNVTLVSRYLHGAKINAEGAEAAVKITATDVTLKGFRIYDTENKTVSGVLVNTTGSGGEVRIVHNRITGISGKGTYISAADGVFKTKTANAAFEALEKELKDRNITNRTVDPASYLDLAKKFVGASYGIKVEGNAPEALVVKGNRIEDIGKPRTPSLVSFADDEIDKKVSGEINLTDYIREVSLSTGNGVAVVNASGSNLSIRGNSFSDIRGGVDMNPYFIYNLKNRIYELAESQQISEEEIRSFELSNVDSLDKAVNRDLKNATVADALRIVETEIEKEGINATEFDLGSHGVIITEDYGSEGKPERVYVSQNSFENVDLGVTAPGFQNATVMENSFENTQVDILEADFLSGNSVNATGNWFGTDGVRTYGDVKSAWSKTNTVTLEPGEERSYGLVIKVPMDVRSGNYSLGLEARTAVGGGRNP